MENKKYIYNFWPTLHGYKIDKRQLVYLATSVECSKSYTNDIHVYTDSIGAIEIDKIGLECNKVIFDLDTIKSSGHLGTEEAKLSIFKMQDQPFCYVDTDVFLDGFVLPSSTDLDLVVQSTDLKQKWGIIYKKFCDLSIKLGINFPAEVVESIQDNQYCGYNYGYLDIRNINAISSWIDQGIDLISQLNKLNISNNTIALEMLLFSLCKKNNLNVLPLIPDDVIVSKKIQDNPVSPVIYDGYIHLLKSKDTASLSCMCGPIYLAMKILERKNKEMHKTINDIIFNN